MGGIGDYATRSGGAGVLSQTVGSERPKPISPYSAKPNLGHRVIAALAKEGLVWRFIQQNHDGLPQKAGVPQGVMNEIHGGWFDPSNPVVSMKGSLREDLFSDLLECERQADLVLAIGSAIVALQRTPHDENSSVRVFATIDKVFAMLADELSLSVGEAGQDAAFSVPS